MKLTDEQLVAFLAFGLLIMNESEALLVDMSRKELKQFAEDVHGFLSPFVDEESDVVSPVVSILKEAIAKVKGEK